MYTPNNVYIHTAEELFDRYANLYQFEEGRPEYLIDKEDFKDAVIEFATMHVQAATDEHAYWANRDVREDLVNSYPLTNIK